MSRLLVVDDQESVAFSTGVLLRRAGYKVDVCSNGEKALNLTLRNQYDVVISDLRMEKTCGLELLQKLRAQAPATEVIIMTAFASIETAVEAMRQGAFDYICKPFEADDLLIKVKRAIEKKELGVELAWLREDFRSRRGYNPVIGSSPSLRFALGRVQTIAPTDCTVLLTGETGTGKSLFARLIHATSHRAGKPFVSINCANLSEQLLESELFGSIKGAYTGAELSRPGLCEAAHEGTLFLDEIGAASVTVQSKLLTLLEDKTVRRLGDTHSIHVDIRVIAATNAELHDRIRQHEFREDLFYRLNVASIHIPPLREHREDIPLLAEHFLAMFAKRYKKSVHGFTAEAMQYLLGHPFPGNVRELENAIEQAVLAASSELIGSGDLGMARTTGPTETAPCEERELILKGIATNKYNLRKTARMLGVSRATLYRKLHKYGIDVR